MAQVSAWSRGSEHFLARGVLSGSYCALQRSHFVHITPDVIDLLPNTCRCTAGNGLSLTLPTLISRSTPELITRTKCWDFELHCDLHVHIASVLRLVQLICSWCFCTCRSLMSARVGCDHILRCSRQTGEIHPGKSPLYPRRHDRLRIFCSTLATN